jgi:hypothetical protein
VVGVAGGLVVVVDEGAVVVVVADVVVVVTGATVLDVWVVVVVTGAAGLVVVVSALDGATVFVPHAAASRVRLRSTAPERFIASPFRKCQRCFAIETARRASTGDSRFQACLESTSTITSDRSLRWRSGTVHSSAG